jgi:hypothetical protein
VKRRETTSSTDTHPHFTSTHPIRTTAAIKKRREREKMYRRLCKTKKRKKKRKEKKTIKRAVWTGGRCFLAFDFVCVLDFDPIRLVTEKVAAAPRGARAFNTPTRAPGQQRCGSASMGVVYLGEWTFALPFNRSPFVCARGRLRLRPCSPRLSSHQQLVVAVQQQQRWRAADARLSP